MACSCNECANLSRTIRINSKGCYRYGCKKCKGGYICGCIYGVELHHIVFKSSVPCMRNIKLNFKYLCGDKHHRGDKGPHKNRYVDLIYKLELQDKLFKLLDKDFYRGEEIQQKLETTSSTARKICKKLMVHKDGYGKTELIKRLMGGMLYTRDMLEEYEYEKPKKDVI